MPTEDVAMADLVIPIKRDSISRPNAPVSSVAGEEADFVFAPFEV
jgi:hypothetical protein